MQDDNKDKKTKLASLEDTLETMIWGYETPEQIRANNALERRRNKRGVNHAK